MKVYSEPKVTGKRRAMFVFGEGGGVKHAQISAVGMSLLKVPGRNDRVGISERISK